MRIDFDIYDIHNHILPGVDDGAKDMEMSMNMIHKAYKEGVRGLILTPHFKKRIWDVDREEIIDKYETLRDNVEMVYPDMKLYIGNEVYYSTRIDDYSDAITMAEGKYILLEFSVSCKFEVICEAVMKQIEKELIPIIAHVERYECLLDDYKRISKLIHLGAYIQVNSKSIDGDNGHKTKSFVKKLLSREEIHFIASDAHSDVGRIMTIKSACKYVIQKYGYDFAKRVFFDNPLCVINNEYIEE